MKAPFQFRPKHNFLFSFLAAMFAAKNMPDRGIKPADRDTAPRRADHRISKKERKRREHLRRINPSRKH